MTTTLAPFGFRAAYHPSGILRPMRRPIVNSAAAIYKGDPVKIGTDGYVVIATSGSGIVDGIFVGCEYYDVTGKPITSNYWPADTNATNVVAWIMEDFNAVYEVQADSLISLTDVGSQLSFNVGTPSTLTGLSGASLKVSTLSTTVENQFVVIDVAPYEGNAWADTYTIARVKLSNAFLGLAPQAQ